VVEDGVVRPVGGKSIEVDARIVSASWASLRERVADGQFRADLYHRLSTLVIELPPLRRRKSDIPELARELLRRFEPELGSRRLSSAALGRLVAHNWPGNVRELSSVLYRAAVAADKTVIDELALEESLPAIVATQGSRPLRADQAAALLERCGGNVSKAARAARVPRSTFRSWLAHAKPDERERDADG
jgi:transcriptional regulator of acetoin/glycerol metabolism